MSDVTDQGYVLVPDVLTEPQLHTIRHAAENILSYICARAGDGQGRSTVWPDGHRLDEIPSDTETTTVHWEPDAGAPTVRSLSPVTHLSPEFAALWDNPALTAPVREFITAAGPGTADTGLDLAAFTSKLNIKRRGVGSAFHWHQDYPFWYACAGPDAAHVVTAMLFLDDATADNGALRVLPGSHHAGPAPRDRSEPTHMLVDTHRRPVDQAVTVTAPAGSALVFPGLLVHGSQPNRSERDRRSLLLCFQPAGRPELSTLSYDPARMDELP